MNDTNALGASDSFTVPDVATCLSECVRVSDCVAVDVNVNARPPLCWPHHRAADLRDQNIFSQPGTNLYRLTGSCASGERDSTLVGRVTKAQKTATKTHIYFQQRAGLPAYREKSSLRFRKPLLRFSITINVALTW